MTIFVAVAIPIAIAALVDSPRYQSRADTAPSRDGTVPRGVLKERPRRPSLRTPPGRDDSRTLFETTSDTTAPRFDADAAICAGQLGTRPDRIRALLDLEMRASLPREILLAVGHLAVATPDAATQFRALRTLSAHQDCQTLSAAQLVELANSPDEDVSRAAIESLGSRRVEPDGAIPALARLARAGTPRQRRASLEAMIRICGASEVPTDIADCLLGDADDAVRYVAVATLVPAMRDARMTFINALADPSDAIRAVAVDSLARMGADILPSIRDRLDLRPDANELTALLELASRVDAMHFLPDALAHLGHVDPRVRAAALEVVLRSPGCRLTTSQSAALGVDPSTDVRQRLPGVVARDDTESAHRLLRSMLPDENPQVRIAVAREVVRFDPSHAVEVLVRELDGRESRTAAHALINSASDSELSILAVRDALTADSDVVRLSIVRQLKSLDPALLPIDLLLDVLAQDDACHVDSRIEVAQLLAELAPDEPRFVSALRAMAENPRSTEAAQQLLRVLVPEE